MRLNGEQWRLPSTYLFLKPLQVGFRRDLNIVSKVFKDIIN